MKEATILFDPVEHKYTDTDGNVYTSVTTYIDEFKPKYDKEYWAYYRAADRAYGQYGIRPSPERREIWLRLYRDDKGKWYTLSHFKSGFIKLKKTPGQILKEWQDNADAACERGNAEHEYLEDCINDFFSWKIPHDNKTVMQLPSFSYEISDIQTLEKSPMKETHPTVYQTLKQLIEAGYTLYAEKRVYSAEHLISGTIDVLAVNDRGEFWIVDWKTNKDPLQFESGYFKKVWNHNRTKKVKTNTWVRKDERMFSPLEDLQVCKGTLYTLQLSLYARLCELWGLKCKGLLLCHLRIEVDDAGNQIKHEPIFYDIMYLPQHIDRILKLRTTPIKNTGFMRKSVKY